MIGAQFPYEMREWRNWQTRYLEVVVRETFWGFESPLSQFIHIVIQELIFSKAGIPAFEPASIAPVYTGATSAPAKA